MKDISYKRHLLKTITWRLVGTIDTMMLAWIITGSPATGLKIGGIEVVTKMILYFLHERLWFRLNLTKDKIVLESKARHLAKTVTWRIVGTLDTMMLGWLVSGNPMTGLKIGLAEIVTKMIFYYIHERIWYRVNYGLPKRGGSATESVAVPEKPTSEMIHKSFKIK